MYNFGTLSVCVSVQDTLSHLKTHLHENLFWANLKHCEVGFFNSNFLRGAVKISVFVVRDNLSHLKSNGHVNLAQRLYWNPF